VAAPIAFSFRNTPDGHKVLFEDGIYAEFAVFGRGELAHIPAGAGRVVWQLEGIDPTDVTTHMPASPEPRPVEWLVGEILTNLYVGLLRLKRGEQLSAARLIQGYAVDALLELCAFAESPSPGHRDPFDRARRFEQRFPETAVHLPDFMQGYDGSVESALALLEFLEQHFAVNAAIKHRITDLASRSKEA
jgi:hypothetical protein